MPGEQEKGQRDAPREKNTPTGVETRIATSMAMALVGMATETGIQSGSGHEAHDERADGEMAQTHAEEEQDVAAAQRHRRGLSWRAGTGQRRMSRGGTGRCR